MTKVHPNAGVPEVSRLAGSDACQSSTTDRANMMETTMTVWCKSLLFNCKGFTVFDSKGNLVFRVDNYPSGGGGGEVVLMDAAGKPLLTIRRKKLSLSDQWLIYDGDSTAKPPRFSARRQINLLHSKLLAHVSPCRGGSGGCYDVEGSYSQRSCTVYDEMRRPVVEIRRKEPVGSVAFGADVFRLVVQPGFDVALAMAMVIFLEQMFGSRGSLSLIKF